MKKIVLLFVLFFSLVEASNNNTYKIEWEFENPFRFFQKVEDYEKVKSAYVDVLKGVESGKYENIGLALEKELQKSNDQSINSWASTFATNYNYNSTCWNSKSMLYNHPKCQDYINPIIYKIKFWVKNAPIKSKCDWEYNGKVYNGLCSKTLIDIVPNQNEHIVNVKMKVKNFDSTIKIGKIKDILVVGLGDSFGSGEGNPDKTATVTGIKSNKDKIFVDNKYLPRKDTKESYAKWLDRRCHRSLYSYQFKTALQLALKNPKQAVTFVSFSCTGATTDNIIDKVKSAKENLSYVYPKDFDNVEWTDVLDNKKKFNKRIYSVAPQLELLDKTLKDKRKIDLILLSTGGNDVGFAKYVMNVLINYKIADIVVNHANPQTEYEVKNKLGKNYNKLDRVIKKKSLLVDDNKKRIILTGYPNILNDENGNLCKEVENSVFTIPFGESKGINRALKLQNIEQYLLKPLYFTQKELTEMLGWGFIDSHIKLYDKHGFCAKKDGDKYIIPFKETKDGKWKGFHPSEYLKYNEKQRWVNIPLDSILKINMTKKTIFGDVDFGFSDETSGIMHPTAEGLAATANENVDFICKNGLVSCK